MQKRRPLAVWPTGAFCSKTGGTAGSWRRLKVQQVAGRPVIHAAMQKTAKLPGV